MNVQTYFDQAFDASIKQRQRPSKDIPLEPVRPNLGIALAYKRRLLALIDEMNNSIVYWLKATYRREPPRIAQDELSSSAMRASIRRLTTQWLGRFDTMADKLAAYFTLAVSKRSDAQLRQILLDGGMAIEWNMTPAQRDVINAIIHENVALIKSIPREHLAKVEGVVMRSVQTGRDLHQLTVDLQNQFGVTRRRAEFIARDQNNKATSLLNRARQIELNIETAMWVHSHAGRYPRPAHVKAGADKVIYNVKQGWFDPHEQKYIWPGTLINCRCIARPIIRGRTRGA